MPVSNRFRAAALGAAVTLGFTACSAPDVADVFGNSVGSGGAGGAGSATSSSSTSSSMSSSSTSSSSSSSSASSSSGSSSSSSVSSSSSGSVCGNMVCEPGEEATCPQDCGGDCSHGVCEAGDPLVVGCDPCVDTVCQADPYCCNSLWDGICVTEATTMCNAACCGNGDCSGETCASCPQDCGACVCGNGICDGEDCASCPQDCGACPTGPTCPHSACFVRGPLNTTDCHDPCIEEVCAQTPSCCQGSPPMWDAACSAQAQVLCGGDPCVQAVCDQDPTCCTDNWTIGCVNIAMVQCATQCNCVHSVCQVGPALTVGCNPCVDAVCLADPACCSSGWDDACRNWVPVFCGIDCG